VNETWDRSAPGILCLPSGMLVRDRALSRPLPDGPVPAFGVYLLGRRPPAVPWESCWLKWPDFRLPADKAGVLPVLTEAWQRAVTERVEFGCAGGHGRTGTALAPAWPSSTASRAGRPSRSCASTTIRTRSRRPVSAAMSPGGERAAPARSTQAAASGPRSTNMGAWA
jgi:hypothetical protein